MAPSNKNCWLRPYMYSHIPVCDYTYLLFSCVRMWCHMLWFGTWWSWPHFSWIHMLVKWSCWVWVLVFVFFLFFLFFGTVMVGVEVWIFCLVGLSLSSNVLERTKCGHVIKTTSDFELSSWFVYSVDELQVWKEN